MNIGYTSSANYPVSRTITIEGLDSDLIPELAGITSNTAWERLHDFTNAKQAEAGSGNQDLFLTDVNTLVQQYMTALAALEVIAAGRLTSTDENPKYAGGVADERNRIFTPQEAALNALKEMGND